MKKALILVSIFSMMFIGCSGKKSTDKSTLNDIVKLINSKQGIKVTIYVNESNIPKEIENATLHGDVTIKTKKIVLNPITIIDDSIIWYGKPFSRVDFVSQADDCHVVYRPVFRFVGDNTAKKIKSLL